PGFSNLVIIFFVIFLGGWGIDYLALGTLCGMAGILLIQLPSLARSGFKYYWDWNIRHVEVRGIFYNLLPIFLGTAVNQIYLAINRYFASGLGEGSISALNYAGKLMNLPLGVFVLAVSSAIFPTLAEYAVKEDRIALGGTLNRGLKIVLLITLPAAAGLMALSTPIVRLLFERGAFDHLATVMTSGALVWFTAGMFAMAVNMVLTRAYYAVSDVRTPLYVGGLSIVVNIIASRMLTGPMGHNGLALANTLAAVFSAVVLYALLKRHLPKLYFADLMISAGKALTASVLTAFTALAVFSFLAGLLTGPGSLSLLVQVMGAIAAGAVVYGVSILVLREKEVFTLLDRLKDRLRRYS
ncbi:MAG: murein biosynthesis integral membrane protein MurJ, partial [Clostridia bacterium]|nr:murein biosynthesis integral membrane protein MurJ [Clostridia bacterium]